MTPINQLIGEVEDIVCSAEKYYKDYMRSEVTPEVKALGKALPHLKTLASLKERVEELENTRTDIDRAIEAIGQEIIAENSSPQPDEGYIGGCKDSIAILQKIKEG